MYPSQNMPPQSVLVGTSGDRVVAYTTTDDGVAVSLVPNAGTAFAQANSAGARAMLGNPQSGCGSHLRYALLVAGADGAVLGGTSNGNMCQAITNATAGWLLPDAEANTLGSDPITEVEGYFRGDLGAIAPLDTTQALVITGETMPAVTSLHVVARSGGFVAGRNGTLPIDLTMDRVAAAASNGLGFVLTSDTTGASLTVRIADARCQ
jgi:hypothetical protein